MSFSVTMLNGGNAMCLSFIIMMLVFMLNVLMPSAVSTECHNAKCRFCLMLLY
jgi:hypothetical protein